MRDYKLQLEDILDSSKKIERYVKGLDYRKFVKNELVVDAVIRNLEIIGEAARQVSDDVKQSAPDVEWHKLMSLRNILIHEYFGVDNEILWDIVKNKIPGLKRSISSLLK